MYRSCIFCSAALGANESIERFPVGKSLAFDGEKGRLWAVCPKCARWNLAPIEERWEAIEDAECLFHDCRTRAQRENIGLAKLADGTRLVRVGEAVPEELAVWRYGEELDRRRRRALVLGGLTLVAGGAVVTAGVAVASVGAIGAVNLFQGYQYLVDRVRGARPLGEVRMDVDGVEAAMRVRDVDGAWLSDPGDGRGIALNFPCAVEAPDPRRPGRTRKVPLVLRGDDVLPVLGRAMVHVNSTGASGALVKWGLQQLREAGSPEDYIAGIARRRRMLNGADTRGKPLDLSLANGPVVVAEPEERKKDWRIALPLEMALHEWTERRALDGELAGLAEMWKQAEEIAAIADRLPGVPAAEPPRLRA